MNSGDWNKWLTLGANLGVFVGLILVAYEINQSGTHLELAASSDGTDNFTQAMEVLVQNEELSRLIYRAETSYEDLDDFERWRVTKYLDGFMTMSEQDYSVYIEIKDNQNPSGMRDDWRENMKLPMYSEYWSRSEERFRPGFRHFINDIIAEKNAAK